MALGTRRGYSFLLASTFLLSSTGPVLSDCLDFTRSDASISGSSWDQGNTCEDGSTYALTSLASLHLYLDTVSGVQSAQKSLQFFAMRRLLDFIYAKKIKFAAIRVQNPYSEQFEEAECHIFQVDQATRRPIEADINDLEILIPPTYLSDGYSCEDVKASIASILFLESQITQLQRDFPDLSRAEIVASLKAADDFWQIAKSASSSSNEGFESVVDYVSAETESGIQTLVLDEGDAKALGFSLSTKGLELDEPWSTILFTSAETGAPKFQISRVSEGVAQVLGSEFLQPNGRVEYIISWKANQDGFSDWRDIIDHENASLKMTVPAKTDFEASGGKAIAQISTGSEQVDYSLPLQGLLFAVAKLSQRYHLDLQSIPATADIKF